MVHRDRPVFAKCGFERKKREKNIGKNIPDIGLIPPPPRPNLRDLFPSNLHGVVPQQIHGSLAGVRAENAIEPILRGGVRFRPFPPRFIHPGQEPVVVIDVAENLERAWVGDLEVDRILQIRDGAAGRPIGGVRLGVDCLGHLRDVPGLVGDFRPGESHAEVEVTLIPDADDGAMVGVEDVRVGGLTDARLRGSGSYAPHCQSIEVDTLVGEVFLHLCVEELGSGTRHE